MLDSGWLQEQKEELLTMTLTAAAGLAAGAAASLVHGRDSRAWPKAKGKEWQMLRECEDERVDSSYPTRCT